MIKAFWFYIKTRRIGNSMKAESEHGPGITQPPYPQMQDGQQKAEEAVLSRGVALLFAVTCGLAVANVYFAQPLLDSIASEFGFSQANVGIVMTVTQMGYGVGLILLVPLGDLVNRRKLIIGQSLLSALALLAVAMARDANVLLASLAIIGLLAVVTQVLVAYAAQLAPPGERGRAVGTVTSGIILGILLARTASGFLSDVSGWRTVYIASAVATLVVTGLLFHILPRKERPRAPVTYPRLIGSVFLLFFQVPVLLIRSILAMFIFMTITILLTPLVLPLAAPPISFTHTQIGMFGLAGAAGALGAANAGRMADRGLAQRTTLIGLTTMLAAWPLIALLPVSLPALVAGVLVVDYGLQAVHVSNQSLIYRQKPEAQSRLTAGYMIFYSIGSAIGSIASTMAYAQGGWNAVCLAGAVTSAAALLFWRLTSRLTPQ
jgi:predicted MFS family arabinose efflux permease